MAKKINKDFEMIAKIAQGLKTTKQSKQTVLELVSSEEENSKTLMLKSGKWNSKEPWFIVDEKQKLHALVSVESLQKMVETFKKLEEDAFVTKLERSILQQLPIDFQDVWTVAMEEIEKRNQVEIDHEKLVRKIKKEHPNLFLDLKDFYLPEGVNFVQPFE